MHRMGIPTRERAARVPKDVVIEWQAAYWRERSRESLHYLEDQAAVGGVQGEQELIAGKEPEASADAPRYRPKGFEEHLERRRREASGLPLLAPVDRDQERVDAFIGQATAEWAAQGIEVKLWRPPGSSGEDADAGDDDRA
jgi:hypothetical protein